MTTFAKLNLDFEKNYKVHVKKAIETGCYKNDQMKNKTRLTNSEI